jgi:polyisoprenoid-binding protein YceI
MKEHPPMTTTESTPITRIVDGTEVPTRGVYALDPSHSHVGFSVRHLMVSKTKGRFAEVSGAVHIADDPLESFVEVDIPVASIDTRDETRDGHLRSADFLDADNHPSLSYRSTKITPAGKDRWIVDGELTVRGVTRPVPLDVTFEGGAKDPWGGSRIGFTAQAELDREAFGLTWNQALETGGVLVGKQVRIEIEAEAIHQ